MDRLFLGMASIIWACAWGETHHFALSSYGHGVLRNPDPRFIALQEFCDTRPNLLADPIVQLVKKA